MNIRKANKLLESVKTELRRAPMTESEDPADLADDLITQGFNHGEALGAIQKSFDALQAALTKAQTQNAGIKKHGGGAVSAPALVKQFIKPELVRLRDRTDQLIREIEHFLK